MEFFKLQQPGITQDDRLKVIQAFEDAKKREELSSFLKRANEPEYKYWDAVKHQRPLPAELSPAQSWYAVKMTRLMERNASRVRSEDGHLFGWVKLSIFERYCHELDLHAGGELLTSVNDLKVDEKKRLVSKGLMDEAIASAQLEGADTGRAYAQKMLREKIRPRNASDQMILNNHQAMLRVEAEYKNHQLSRDLLLEMHSILTENTLDSEGLTPSLRNDDRPLYVHDDVGGIVYYRAPSYQFAHVELDRLIEFANTDGENFVHPIVKAAILHFWIGFLHSFTDGNGRLARLIFYWYLLRHGYWAFAYLPIAANIKKGGKKRYTMSYVYAEQDSYDLTYFVNYILEKSMEAFSDFQKYVLEMRKSNKEVANFARTRYGLNDRQIQLIKYLAAKEDNSTTIKSHMIVSGISRLTAINDLNGLVDMKLAVRKKIGRTIYFYGSRSVSALLKSE